VGCSPNGRNINMKCGSTEPDLLRATVKGLGADVGIALDGDGDRVVMADELGDLVDGDQLIFILAVYAQSQGTLRGPVVGTVMSNLGLELALEKRGVEFLRAAVGDRNVLAMLKDKGGELGGETSGHVIDLSTSTTGDGLVTALRVLHVMTTTGKPLSELAAEMAVFPQVMINVSADRDLDLTSSPEVVDAVARVEEQMAGRGRVVLRASGTEPVIRVMVEGENAEAVNDAAEEIANRVREAAASH
jgi:phosphoglucosamine mutase